MVCLTRLLRWKDGLDTMISVETKGFGLGPFVSLYDYLLSSRAFSGNACNLFVSFGL